MGCAGLTIAGGVLEIAGFALVAYELARIQRREFGEPEFLRRLRGWLRRLLRRPVTHTAEAGAAPISLHLCRHTFASLLIDSGANPKAIQEFMGHSKIQTTFDVYGHLLPGSHDEVRARMDSYLASSVASR